MTPDIQQAWANCFDFTLYMGWVMGMMTLMWDMELDSGRKERLFWGMLVGTLGMGMAHGWLGVVMEVMR